MEHTLVAREDVKFEVNAKELNGILTFPDLEAPYPAIVLLHGADRGSMNNPYYEEHAETLIHSGIAVLRYDAPNNVGFETLEYRAEEAIAAVKYLQSRSDINASAVGLWGFSQGGWICQMAAAAYEGVAFIIPVSGPGVTPAEQEVYRVEMESRAAAFSEDETAKAVLMRRLMVDIVLNEPIYQEVNMSESLRLGNGPWSNMTELTYRQPPTDLLAEFGEVVEILKAIKNERWARFLHLDDVLPMFDTLPPQAWGAAKAQIKAIMEVEPAQFLTRVHCPVLAIFGESDTSIPVEKSITLYKQYLAEANNENFTVKVFPKASHAICVGATFADGYFDLMLNWLTNLPVK